MNGVTMNATVAQLTTRTLLGRRRAILLLVLPLVLLALAVAARIAAGQDPGLTVNLVGGFGLGTLVPLIGLIVGTGAIASEIDDGSIIYLLSKPVSRFSIVRTKFAVAASIATVVTALPIFGAGSILSGTSDRLAIGYAVGAAVAGLAYCALFLLLSVLVRSAVVVGLIYALLWESVIGGFVPGAQALSVQQWSLAITEALVGDAAAGHGVSSAVSLTTAIVLLVVVIVGSLTYAGFRLRTLRLTGDE